MNTEVVSVPLLSICVPTYNRASSLRNLFRTLKESKERWGNALEICMSDNASDDDTRMIIEEHEESLCLKVIRQSHNIGGTLNIIAVTQMITGRWGMLVGDDDEAVPEMIGELMERLKLLVDEGWILVDAADVRGQSQYLSQFPERRYTNVEFRRMILKTGLNPFGFMGVHVFPRSAIASFQSLSLADAQPWPHIAAMLRELSVATRGVRVIRRTVILQAKGGAKLFWNGGDLARIRLAKIKILMRAFKTKRQDFLFYHLAMLRELYALSSLTSLLAWKLYERKDFSRNAFSTYMRAYSWLGAFAFLTSPHAVLMSLLYLLPNSVYIMCFDLIGKGYLLTRYETLKSELGVFDGMKRGI